MPYTLKDYNSGPVFQVSDIHSAEWDRNIFWPHRIYSLEEKTDNKQVNKTVI